MFNQHVPMKSDITKNEIKSLKKKSLHDKNIESLRSGKKKVIKLESFGQVDNIKASILSKLDEIVIGQDKAKKVFLDIIGARLFSNKPNKKGVLGAALFVGPTGVGKTQLGEALAEVLLGDEQRVTIIEGELYQHEHEIAKLIGSPPGYLGHGTSIPKLADSELFKHYKAAEKDHTLNNLIKLKKNFSIIIVDEFEKMHEDIRQAFLNVLSTGEVKMNTGKEEDKHLSYSNVTNFRNCIFIFTSNCGTQSAGKHLGFGAGSEKQIENHYMDSIKKSFSREFLGRINRNIVVFDELTTKEVKGIIKKRVRKIQDEVFDEKKHLQLVFDTSVENYLVEKGYNKETGARQLVTTIDYEIAAELDKLSYEGIFDDLDTPSKIVVKREKDDFGIYAMRTRETKGKTKREVEFTEALIRSKTLDIMKGGEIVFPLHNGSMIMTLDKLLGYMFNYLHLFLYRDTVSTEFEGELAFMEKNLLDLGMPKNDIEILKSLAKNKFVEENFSVLNEFIGLQLSTDSEKNVFYPYNWTVVKKIVERKIEEYIFMDPNVEYDVIRKEIETILLKWMKKTQFKHAETKEILKLFHHHYLTICPKKQN